MVVETVTIIHNFSKEKITPVFKEGLDLRSCIKSGTCQYNHFSIIGNSYNAEVLLEIVKQLKGDDVGVKVN